MGERASLTSRARPHEQSLTDDHEEEEDGGQSSADVQQDSDVLRQLVDVVHVGHQHRRDQEAQGDAQLRDRGAPLRTEWHNGGFLEAVAEVQHTTVNQARWKSAGC